METQLNDLDVAILFAVVGISMVVGGMVYRAVNFLSKVGRIVEHIDQRVKQAALR